MTGDKLFEQGLALLRNRNYLGALACFEKAQRVKKTPDLQSYLGLCIARERGQISEAIFLCKDAITQEPDNPVYYLNLGRVYMKAGRKADAIETLRKGLSFGDNAEIRGFLDEIGTRRNPVFSVFPRKNFLNRYLGLLLSRLKLR
jgi:tetratricopeptide (TPR) repeat protein